MRNHRWFVVKELWPFILLLVLWAACFTVPAYVLLHFIIKFW